jgi:hypothetical protein
MNDLLPVPLSPSEKHLRGATVRDWPLNVFTIHDDADQLLIMRAIVTSDLHNLVFQADYRIIPPSRDRRPSRRARRDASTAGPELVLSAKETPVTSISHQTGTCTIVPTSPSFPDAGQTAK